MSAFPQEGLERLAERVVAGDVVFFIGAGFSLDSEGNSAARLIRRLLARFEALTASLAEDRLLDALKETFHLQGGTSTVLTRKNVDSLVRDYYLINDWMCSAYSRLLGDLDRLRTPGFVEMVHAREQELLESKDILQPMDLTKLALLSPRDRGKALFLDTMGFSDLAVMAGEPLAPEVSAVAASYGDRLRPRHHVLARFAREGFCPMLLTTNYDLLIEGAYRLAGFSPREAEGIQPHRRLPPTTFQHFSRIASATQFFGQGDDKRSAFLLKIHGCTESYRQARDATQSHWSAYLPSMVFTFREIQNWREDSWSRDLVSTLLRTRTIVFCGYSTADPVLHDTMRTVYEERAKRRRQSAVPQVTPSVAGPGAETAPAFFLGTSGKTEFHGLEILRAASQAVGDESPPLANHPNYLRFYLRPQKGKSPRFPNLDESLLWLFHLAFRKRQRQALESDLSRVVTLLLGYPCPSTELQEVIGHFEALAAAEAKAAGQWEEKPTSHSRRQFQRIASWTDRFQVGLLREFALAEMVLRSQGPGLDLDDLRRSAWYYPTSDHPDWTAWAAVAEVALRRRIASWRRAKEEDWARDSPWVSPGEGEHPNLLAARSGKEPTPLRLILRLGGFGRPGERSKVVGIARREDVWELRYDAIPWDRKASGSTPPAQTLWDWAHQPLADVKEPWSMP